MSIQAAPTINASLDEPIDCPKIDCDLGFNHAGDCHWQCTLCTDTTLVQATAKLRHLRLAHDTTWQRTFHWSAFCTDACGPTHTARCNAEYDAQSDD